MNLLLMLIQDSDSSQKVVCICASKDPVCFKDAPTLGALAELVISLIANTHLAVVSLFFWFDMLYTSFLSYSVSSLFLKAELACLNDVQELPVMVEGDLLMNRCFI